MPLIKTQEEKSLAHRALQPQNMTSRIQLIIMMDISGYTNNDIAKAIGLSVPRVSVIRNSPMYKQQREVKWGELSAKVVDKASDKVVAGDPVENKIKGLALEAVGKYEDLLGGAKSEFVRKAVADAILDRAGYRPHTDRTVVSIEVTEKMANRFERVLGYESAEDARTPKIRVKTEVSS